MLFRACTAVLAILLGLLAFSPVVSAGGWAVTTVDGVPNEIIAGETYTVTYSILQHGQHPVSVNRTFLRITSEETGTYFVIPAEELPTEGSYSADIVFPEAGDWSWEVHQGVFGDQQLGVLRVQDAAGGSAFWSGSITRIVLLLTSLVMAILLGIQLYWFRRNREIRRPALKPLQSGTPGD